MRRKNKEPSIFSWATNMAAAAASDNTAAISAVLSVVDTIANTKQEHAAALKDIKTRYESIFKQRTSMIPSVAEVWRTNASNVCAPIAVDMKAHAPLVYKMVIGISSIFGPIRSNPDCVDIRVLHGLPATPEIEEAIKACRDVPGGISAREALAVLLVEAISRTMGVPITEDGLECTATKSAGKRA